MRSKGIVFVVMISIIVFIVGLLLGKMIDVPGFTLNKEINPLHAISILVPLIIAIVFTWFFSREQEKERVLKSILIKRIGELVEFVDYVQDRLMNGEINIHFAPTISKKIWSALTCTRYSIVESKSPVPFDVGEAELILRKINRLITETPSDGGGNTETTTISNGIYNYSLARKSEINRNLDNAKNALYRLQIRINSG